MEAQEVTCYDPFLTAGESPLSQPEARGVPPLTREGSLFDAPPEAFGSYRVLEEIGPGRFGPVYRARHEATGAIVVVKVFDQGLTPEHASMLATTLGKLGEAPLDHPSIVPTLGAGVEGGRAWLVEPWADATPLDAVMRQDGSRPPADVVVRVTQLAGALDFAAAAGIHHGALHPRDVLTSPARTLVAGIGVLEALGEAGLEVPMEGAYVSPQRAQGLAIAPQDDIYSLAAITFELVYGSPVPVHSALRDAMTRLDGVDMNRFVDVLEGSLSPDPGDRPALALHFAAALQRALLEAPIPVRNSVDEVGVPLVSPDSSRIPITSADAAIPAPPARVPEPIGDLPLRAASPMESGGSSHPNAESRGWDSEAEFHDRSVNSGARSQRPESESASGPWFAIAASLAIGILVGFASGFVVGQRDTTPAPRSAERAVARAQRTAPADQPAPTAGRDFTESNVPSHQVTEQPVIPPPEQSTPRGQPERPERERNERTESEPSAPLEPSTLTVDSRPRGARVFVDGRLVGTTPLSLAEVQPGEHAVRIDLIGYQPWVTSLNVPPGTRQRVAASLTLNGER